LYRGNHSFNVSKTKEKKVTSIVEDIEANQETVVCGVIHDIQKLLVGIETKNKEKIEMYLQQRFKRCSLLLDRGSTTKEHQPKRNSFPLEFGRELLITGLKLLERREFDGFRSGSSRIPRMLPTPFLAFVLDEKNNPSDDELINNKAVSLSCFDAQLQNDPTSPGINESLLKVRVLDIGPIRPARIPERVQRQVITLGEMNCGEEFDASVSKPNSQRLTRNKVFLVLWDDQVALSHLFHVGHALLLLHPFVHLMSPQDPLIAILFADYTQCSQAQKTQQFFFEYGSATVVFVAPQNTKRIYSSSNSKLYGGLEDARFKCSPFDQTFLQLQKAQSSCRNLSVYGVITEISVSYGYPLLAAFSQFYYHNGGKDPTSSFTSSIPIEAYSATRHSLVVLVKVYDTQNQQELTVEVTGSNAVKILKLQRGQTALFENLVLMNIETPEIHAYRDNLLQASTQDLTLAFLNMAYTSTVTEGIMVALCSDWLNLFGVQSDFHASNVFCINTNVGLFKSLSILRPSLMSLQVHYNKTALVACRVTISCLGWLGGGSTNVSGVNSTSYRLDGLCEYGTATCMVHKACMRSVQREDQSELGAKWKCSYCHELWTGMDDVEETFGPLIIQLDDGMTDLIGICSGETVQSLLQMSAGNYSQLSVLQKRQILKNAVKDGDLLVVLSTSADEYEVEIVEEISTSLMKSQTSQDHFFLSPEKSITRKTVKIRIDLIQRMDVHASSMYLLDSLH
jgi:hypothetical protein